MANNVSVAGKKPKPKIKLTKLTQKDLDKMRCKAYKYII